MAPYQICRPDRRQRAFTLLEVLVATAVFAVLLGCAFAVIDQSSKAIRRSNAKIDAFQSARAAFDIMTRELSQATLNTYWDYFDANGQPRRLAGSTTFTPTFYGRYSDLHFISGMASELVTQVPPNYTVVSGQAIFYTAPLGQTARSDIRGVPDMLSACGYFVAFGSSASTKPDFVQAPATYRWRLMELSTSAEDLSVTKTAQGTDWFTQAIAAGQVRPIAENVIALVIWPRLPLKEDPSGTSLAPDFNYDSRTNAPWSSGKQPVQGHQLPPVLQVTMVVIDEGTAKRWENGASAPSQVSTALDQLFTGSVAQIPEDITILEQRLNAARAEYRIFNTSITLGESKWSP